MGGRQHNKPKKKKASPRVVLMPHALATEPPAEPKIEDQKSDSPQFKMMMQKPPERIAVWTLYVGIVVAVIYAFQLEAMRDSVTLTQQIANTGDAALHLQTRPWIGVFGTIASRAAMTVSDQLPSSEVDVPYSVVLAPDLKYFVSYNGAFEMKNYGSMPALHAAYSVAMAADRKDAEKASNGACEAANKAATSGHDSSGSKAGRGGIVLFPGAQEPEPFTAGAGVSTAALPSSVFLMGCIVYQETSSEKWHTTRFCQYGLPNNNRAQITCDLQTYAD